MRVGGMRQCRRRRTHDHRTIAFHAHPVGVSPGGTARHGIVADGHLSDLMAHGPVDASNRNAVVDHDIVVSIDEVVDDHGAIIHNRHLMRRRAITIRPGITETIPWHEGIAGGREIESKTDVHRRVAISESHPDAPSRPWWHRRPAAIVVARAPRHPGRSPAGVRPPAPSMTWMIVPASVVECGAAPRVVGLPVPSAVAVKPAATLAIGTPSHVDDRDRGTPAPAIGAVQIDPGSIGCQIFLKIGDGGGNRSHFRGGNSLLHNQRCRCARGVGLGGRFRRLLRVQPCHHVPVMLHHQVDHLAFKSEILEINDLIGAQVVVTGRVGDEIQNHGLLNTGLGESHHLGERGADS